MHVSKQASEKGAYSPPFSGKRIGVAGSYPHIQILVLG